MATHDNGANVIPCSYKGCNRPAYHIWRNAIDAYCNDHYWKFRASEKRLADKMREMGW